MSGIAVTSETRVYLDTSVLLAAVWSETGGSRLILKLAEAGALQVWVGPWVLRELDTVLAVKSAESRPHLVLLLDAAKVRIGPAASAEALRRARSALDYLPDAQILAEALEIGVDYLVSLDRKHLAGNDNLSDLPLVVGTPGDFIAWYRKRFMPTG
jgi:predicted nucleic acid-binding protein